MFGCLAWFCVDATRGVDFGLAMLWFMIFTPCSFVCWYRPLYGAFRWVYKHTDTQTYTHVPKIHICTHTWMPFIKRQCLSLSRSDSSFRFFVFFFVYICQFGVHVMQSVGISGWGAR